MRKYITLWSVMNGQFTRCIFQITYRASMGYRCSFGTIGYWIPLIYNRPMALEVTYVSLAG